MAADKATATTSAAETTQKLADHATTTQRQMNAEEARTAKLLFDTGSHGATAPSPYDKRIKKKAAADSFQRPRITFQP
jgi:hypothetical protein